MLFKRKTINRIARKKILEIHQKCVFINLNLKSDL